MKLSTGLAQLTLLAAVGCSGPAAPVADSPASTTPSDVQVAESVDDAAATLVSLKVPNMF